MCDGNGGSYFPHFSPHGQTLFCVFVSEPSRPFSMLTFFYLSVSNISVQQDVFQRSFQKMTNHGKVTKGLGDVIGEMRADDQVSSNLTQD